MPLPATADPARLIGGPFAPAAECAVLALREAGRLQEAEAAVAAALQRFPDDAGLRIEAARVSQAAGHWNEAAERWNAVRATSAGCPDAYIEGARALRDNHRYDEAEALLADAMGRFPAMLEPALEHARVALAQGRWDEAASRFSDLRSNFPGASAGWHGGAEVLCCTFGFDAAEALLEDGMRRFPDQPFMALEHALVPVAHVFAQNRDWPEAMRRLVRLQAAFPDFEAAFAIPFLKLREAGLAEQAEAVAEAGTLTLPGSYELALRLAEAAEDRLDWPAALTRYTRVKDRFPERPGGEAGMARALAGLHRCNEAEAMLRQAIDRFPDEPAAFAAYAGIAEQQENWLAAVERWDDAIRRFPREKAFGHRGHEARLRLSGCPSAAIAFASLTPAPIPDPDRADAQVRDMLMQFESLGGYAMGCEFGTFQRDCGAEPLSLLRWSDMPFEKLLFVLRNRFAGVGSDEHSELFVTAGCGRPEYCTQDRRGMMFMRAFIYEDQVPFEKMQVLARNRLRFLTGKLIADLEQGDKIFVYRLTARNLTGDELGDLHAAMRSYGDNTLLYVRYEDPAHPNGLVEMVRPGLMVAYVDHFKLSKTNELSAAPPAASWLRICRGAFEQWRRARSAI